MPKMTKIAADALKMIPSVATLKSTVPPKFYDAHATAALDALDDRIQGGFSFSARDCLRVIGKEPFSTDAYIHLSGVKGIDPETALQIIDRGLCAAEIALGETFMEEEAGDFYSLLQSRPFMRLMAKKFDLQIEMGQINAAIDTGIEAIRLSRNDNIGVRGRLMTLLLGAERFTEAHDLLAKYEDDITPGLTFGAALLAISENRMDEVPELLEAAARWQKHVLPALVGDVILRPDSTQYGIRCGGQTEAMLYLLDAARLWEKTPGALDAVRAFLAGPAPAGLGS